MALLSLLPTKYKGIIAACVTALILFIVAAVFGDRGLIHLLRMRDEQRQLEQMVFARQQANEQLRQRIRRLESDDRYIEKLVRERLGWVKDGEIVYRAQVPPPPVQALPPR